MKTQVVLVNAQDEVMGVAEKMLAHQEGLLHRAFSVFIYRKGETGIEFLLQQRQQDKYHCGGLWTNTCCSHPHLNEEIIQAGARRLKEEMSIEVPLRRVGSFLYNAKFDNGLTEHELDHVLVGEYTSSTAPIVLDLTEVQDFRWIPVADLLTELSLNAEQYTPWLKPALQLVLEDLCINY
jgi:isopentenyl-diphosphate delta-isomerase type 1